MREAVEYINMANRYAYSFAHPAYRRAEELLAELSDGDRKVLLSLNPLKPVIGRGLRSDDV